MPHKTTLFFVLFSMSVFAQTNGIHIVNEVKGKEVFIEESKRIRIKASDGERITGKFKILDNERFLIAGKIVKLNEIEKIKKNPKVISILVDGVLIYVGSAMVFLPLITYPFTLDKSGFLFIIPGIAALYGGKKSPNLHKAYKTKKQWSYSIINHSKPKAGSSFSDAAAAIPSLSQAK